MNSADILQLEKGKKNNSEIIDYKSSFKEKIDDLLKRNTSEEGKIDIEKVIERFIKIELNSFIRKSELSFFDNYKNQDSRFKRKFEKYFPIHEKIIYKVLYENILKLENKSGEYIKNEIRNIINKYLYILFIFSEKIKLNDLENFLEIDLNNLSFIFSGAKNDITELESLDDNLEKNIQDWISKMDIEQNGEIIDSINLRLFSQNYRQVYRQITSGKSNGEKGKEIADKIEVEFKNALEEIFYIFEVWIESGNNINDSRLRNIEVIIIKFFEALSFMKKSDIAFASKPFSSINKGFINEVIESLDIKSEYIDIFKEFTEILLENYRKIIENKENEAKVEELKNNFYEKLKNTKNKIIKIQNENSRKKTPEKLEEQTFKIEDVNFQTWQKTPEIQKYQNLLSGVIAENGIIKLADFLHINDNKKFNDLFEVFYEVTKGFKINKSTLKKQFEEIKSYEGRSVEDFIKNDINNLNLLILWWRFILKVRILESENSEINIENINNFEEKEYGVIERISEGLYEKSILPSDKIIFNPDGRVRNTSIKGVNTLIKDLTKGFQKGFVDLGKEEIELINGEIKVIGKIQNLYMPKKFLEATNDYHKDEITTYINNGINVCYNILKEEKIAKNEYIEILLEQNIIPKESVKENKNGEILIENLTINQKVTIQKLVEILKYILKRISSLEGMFEAAKKDKKILVADKNLNNLLKGGDSGFGPDKTFSRAFMKLIMEYGGDFNKIGDLTRLRIVGNDIDDVIKKVIDFIKVSTNNNQITHISVVDKTGEPLSLPKSSGYRDVKLLLKLKSGNTAEVQFQFKEMFEAKDKGLDLSDEENKNIIEKMKKEGALFTKEEIEQLLKTAKERNIDLPTIDILKSLMENQNENINWEEYEELLNTSEISTDYTYHITRQLEKGSSIGRKLTRLERVLADSAWSKIVIKYLNARKLKIN